MFRLSVVALARPRCCAPARSAVEMITDQVMSSTSEAHGTLSCLIPSSSPAAQFGLNIGFHILFPTITIALAWFLVYLRVRSNRTGEDWLARAYRLWVKIFALSFALGVVSGITMSFQFGTNWPGFMEQGRQHRRAAARLRSAHRIFPRSHVPRRDAVRARPRAAPGCTPLAASLVAVGTTARRSGSSRSTRGCRRRRASRSIDGAAACRPTGWRSSSIRASRTASRT